MTCGARALRKATKDDYRKVIELMMIQQKKDIQIRAKAREILDKTGKIHQSRGFLLFNHYTLLKDNLPDGQDFEDFLEEFKRT